MGVAACSATLRHRLLYALETSSVVVGMGGAWWKGHRRRGGANRSPCLCSEFPPHCPRLLYTLTSLTCVSIAAVGIAPLRPTILLARTVRLSSHRPANTLHRR